MSRFTRHVAAVAFALLAAGCKVGPDHSKPASIVPDKWVEVPAEQATPAVPSVPVAKPAEIATWWAIFEDPILNSLIDRALVANLDLAVADTRIRTARAARDIAESSLWPGV